MTRPWWTTRTSPPENRPARTAPAAKVALSTPVVKAPPPRNSTPTAGKSTRGIAVIMAIRSTTNVIRTFGRVAEISQAVGDRTEAEPGWLGVGADARWEVGQPPQGPEGCGEQHRVDRIGGTEARPGDQERGEQRSDGERDVPQHGLQHICRRQQAWVDQAGDDRGSGRVVDRETGRLEGDEKVEQPLRVQPEHRLQDQPEDHDPQAHGARSARLCGGRRHPPSHLRTGRGRPAAPARRCRAARPRRSRR